MKIIRIIGTENKHVPYLFNKVMPIMTTNKCGGKFLIQEGNADIKVWSDKISASVKAALEKFQIKFSEIEDE